MILRCLFLISVYFIIKPCNAQDVNFTKYVDWNTLRSNAEKENKKILLYFHAPWCVPCKQIEKNLFPDSTISNLLNLRTINISIDIDDSTMVEFIKKYRITAIPEIIVLNKDGFLLDRSSDLPVSNKSEFLFTLKKMLNKREIVKGISNNLFLKFPAFYTSYFNSKNKVETTQQMVSDFLNSQKDTYSEISWAVLSVFANSYENFKKILDNKDLLQDKYGDEVEKKISTNYRKILGYSVEKRDSILFSKVLSAVSKNWSDSVKKGGIYFQWIQFLGRSGMDWPKFQKFVVKYNEEIGSKNNFSFCQVMYKTCNDKQTCSYMALLMKPYVLNIEKPKNYMIYASLLFKSGERSQAEMYFNKALEISKNEEERNFYRRQIKEILK